LSRGLSDPKPSGTAMGTAALRAIESEKKPEQYAIVHAEVGN
jgi:hypothetical protein